MCSKQCINTDIIHTVHQVLFRRQASTIKRCILSHVRHCRITLYISSQSPRLTVAFICFLRLRLAPHRHCAVSSFYSIFSQNYVFDRDTRQCPSSASVCSDQVDKIQNDARQCVAKKPSSMVVLRRLTLNLLPSLEV